MTAPLTAYELAELAAEQPAPRDLGRRVAGIGPYRGWTLHCAWEPEWGERDLPHYSAWNGARAVFLHASFYSFTPTPARFAWLVDNVVLGSAKCGPGPWTDREIDAAKLERAA